MSLVGMPYEQMDCSGLVRAWHLQQRGVRLPEAADDTLPGQWDAVSLPQTGDVVLIRDGGRPAHVGVYLGAACGVRQVLHTTPATGAVVQDLDSRELAPRIMGFYRHVR